METLSKREQIALAMYFDIAARHSNTRPGQSVPREQAMRFYRTAADSAVAAADALISALSE